ncbi:hypothetical protein D3C86_1492590 [compost metagenome]
MIQTTRSDRNITDLRKVGPLTVVEEQIVVVAERSGGFAIVFNRTHRLAFVDGDVDHFTIVSTASVETSATAVLHEFFTRRLSVRHLAFDLFVHDVQLGGREVGQQHRRIVAGELRQLLIGQYSQDTLIVADVHVRREVTDHFLESFWL